MARSTQQATPKTIPLHPVTAIRALSDLLQRASIASAAGMSFGTSRDLYSALGYKRTLEISDYRARYARDDIAGRIVEAFPKATWRGGAELIEDQDPSVETDFEQEFAALEKRLHLWSVFQRADILAGLGRYSVIMIGADGDVATELPRMQSQEGVLFLATYCEDEAKIDSVEEDPANPRYGLPVFYGITRSSTRKTISRRVHWTRVVHIADGVLDQPQYGTPRLERVWNRLDDLQKIVGGGSEAFWLRVHQGMLFKLDKDVKVGDAELTKLKDEAEEFAHQMRRTMAARGFDVETLGSDVANFANQVTSIISLISGATGIPQRILLGSERGELSSTQDKENWDERVQDRRTDYAAPIVDDFVKRLRGVGGLPEVEDFSVRWPEIEDLNKKEQADVADKWAGLNTKVGDVVVTADEIRDHVLGLEPFTKEERAQFEAPPPKVPPPGATEDGDQPPPPPTGEDENGDEDEDAQTPEDKVVVE